jgi:DNA-binding CsgD family transcriptional regulator
VAKLQAERSLAPRGLTEALASARGLFLSGPAGIGKSYLADLLAAEREAAGAAVVSIRATFGSAELPFGAFATHLASADRPIASQFIEIRQALTDFAGERPLLLVVDDIHQLDDASAAMVYQFVTDGQSRLICTARTGHQPPAGVLDLIQSGMVHRHEVKPLDVDQLQTLATDALGCPLDTTTAQRLLAATGGNPLVVKELLLSSLDRGSVERGRDVATISQLPTDAPRLVDLVRARLAHLSPDDLGALRHIAFAEPCDPAEVASVADADTLIRLESAEAIITTENRGQLVIRVAHPIYGEVLRASTGLLQRRAILGSLASDLAARGATRPAEVIKLARLAVDGGIPVDAGVLRKAIAPTMQAGQLDLAERIARRLMEDSDSFSDGMELGRVLHFQGDMVGLREHLDGLRPRAGGPGEHRAIALLEATAERMVGNDAALADRLIAEAIERYPESDDDWMPVCVNDMRAEQCVFRVGSWDNAELEQEVAQYLTDERPLVRLRAHVAASLIHGLGHRSDLARGHVEGALGILGSLGADNPLATIAIRIYETLADITSGDLRAAEQVMSAALAEAADDVGLSLASLYLAIPRALSGRPSSALQVMEAHLDHWDHCRGFMPPRYHWVLRLLCAAMAGDIAQARLALAAYERDPGCLHSLDVFADLGAVRLAVADGRPTDATTIATAAADRWQAINLGYAEAMCRYELVRLGDPSPEARLVELADACDGVLVRTFADQAIALRRHDGTVLAELAERFEAMGCVLYATEAAMQASDALRRDGDQRGANRLLARAAELRGMCESTVTAMPVVDTGAFALSKREREVAMLAAQGMTSRAIAEQLFISSRTAENHLSKVYDKLGVRSRAELSRMLDGGTVALVV